MELPLCVRRIFGHTDNLAWMVIVVTTPYFGAMTVRRLSPTANLLRNSRLFSLPPPLPRPSQDFLSINRFDSDSATLPHPTHASIETSQSSLSRGDWGLKRSLPRQSIASTSTPLIRIGDIDSIDHITDFESAADHTLTLRKWQEMNLPISEARPPQRSVEHPAGLPTGKSVFEHEFDNTEQGIGRGRWKYEGPWLAGKTEGEFQEYVQKDIKRRKDDFRGFLHQHLMKRKENTQKRNARDQGEYGAPGPVAISEAEIAAFIRRLRQDRESLHKLIERFLDLPNYAELSGELSVDLDVRIKSKEKVFRERGPPQTHPSAGLSYLRTASHIYNHPILGPQQLEPPVPGRVLKPQTSIGGFQSARATIGVAGVAASDNRVASKQNVQPPGIATFDPDIPGGARHWYHPEHASIDSRGRIKLSIHPTDQNTLAIYEGVVSEVEELDTSTLDGGTRTFPIRPSTNSATVRDRQKQGYGLEGVGDTVSSGRALPIPDATQSDILELLRVGLDHNR